MSFIAFLTAALCMAQDDPFETHVYNVEFLTKTVEDWPGENLSLSQDAIGTTVSATEMSATRLTGEDLASLIKNNIAEDTWANEKAHITANGATLVVTNLKSVHEKIQQYLAYWRGFFGKMITLDAAVVAIDPQAFAKIRSAGNMDRPAALPPEHARQLLETAREGKLGEILKTGRLTAHPGQRVNLQEMARQTFVRDHDVQIATAAGVLDPIVDVFATGTSIDVRPYLEPFGNAVTLEVRAEFTEPDALEERTLRIGKEYTPVEPAAIEADGKTTATPPRGNSRTISVDAKIQLPRISRHLVRTTLTVKNRETSAVATVTRKGRTLVFLLTPAVVALDDKPAPEPAFEEQRILRLFDVSPLTRGVQDWPGPKMELASPTSGGGGALTGATFTLDEPRVQFQEESVVDLVKTKIAPDTWGNKRNAIQASQGTLFIRQKPDVLKDIERFLGQMLTVRAQMITAEAVVVAFKKGAITEWERTIPALAPGGYYADAADIEKLLEEAYKGQRVRLLDAAEVTCFPQERVHAGRFQQELYIQDFEPQVSSYLSIFDPIIGVLVTGFLLDVRPHFIHGTDNVAVDLRADLAQREFGKEMETVSSGTGPLQMPKGTGLRWRASVTCAKGKWSLVGLESRGRGDDAEDVALFLRARPNFLK